MSKTDPPCPHCQAGGEGLTAVRSSPKVPGLVDFGRRCGICGHEWGFEVLTDEFLREEAEVPEIEITVSQEGKVAVAVKGVAGPGCVELARGIEDALGKTESVHHTAEYYQAAEVDQEVETHG